MDYLGRSILELSSSGGDPAVIIVLQQEVAAIEREITELKTESKSQQDEISTVQGQINSIGNSITSLQNEAKTQADHIARLDGQVVTLNSEILNLSNAIVALQRAPNIADCGSLVLTCPVTTDTATLRVPIGTDWDGFYSTGYSPAGSPLRSWPSISRN